MKLTKQQIDWVKAKLVYEFQESQTSNRYWFNTDEITFLWESNEGLWYALKSNKTWDCYDADDVDEFVDTLSDEQLIEWISDDYFGCKSDDLEEYISDECDALEECA